VALIVRHSAREGRPTGSSNPSLDESLPLTPQGRAHARQFGRNIPPFEHLFLTHTRIERTRDTAEEIAIGFQEKYPESHVEIEGRDPALGMTSFYARDLALLDHWKEKLGMQFYHGWLRGQIPPNALAPVEDAVSDLLDRFHTKLTRKPESSLLLAVTHDVFVFAIRGVLFGDRAGDWPWIGYLDGIVLTWDNAGHVVAHWRDEITQNGLEVRKRVPTGRP
jgi:broad specificity phosphatase PhoE